MNLTTPEPEHDSEDVEFKFEQIAQAALSTCVLNFDYNETSYV